MLIKKKCMCIKTSNKIKKIKKKIESTHGN